MDEDINYEEKEFWLNNQEDKAIRKKDDENGN